MYATFNAILRESYRVSNAVTVTIGTFCTYEHDAFDPTSNAPSDYLSGLGLHLSNRWFLDALHGRYVPSRFPRNRCTLASARVRAIWSKPTYA